VPFSLEKENYGRLRLPRWGLCYLLAGPPGGVRFVQPRPSGGWIIRMRCFNRMEATLTKLLVLQSSSRGYALSAKEDLLRTL